MNCPMCGLHKSEGVCPECLAEETFGEMVLKYALIVVFGVGIVFAGSLVILNQ